MLTAEQRYQQALRKARIIFNRNMRAFLAGTRSHSGPPGIDIERDCLIKEIARAFEAGRRSTA